MIKIVEAIAKKGTFFLEVTENTENLIALAGDLIGPFDSPEEARGYARQFLVPVDQRHNDDQEFFTKLLGVTHHEQNDSRFSIRSTRCEFFNWV